MVPEVPESCGYAKASGLYHCWMEESRKVAGEVVPRMYRVLWDLEKRPRWPKQK